LALEAEEEAPHVLRLDLVEAVAAQVWDDVVVERPPVLDTRRLREAALSAAPVRVDPLPGVLLDRDTGGGPAVIQLADDLLDYLAEHPAGTLEEVRKGVRRCKSDVRSRRFVV